MLTVIDLDALLVDAGAMLDEWEQEFQQNFNSPLMEASMVEAMLEIPPEDQEALRASDPELYDRLNRQVQRMKTMFAKGVGDGKDQTY